VRCVCVLDSRPGELGQLDPRLIEGQLVRLIREVQPQVIVTLGPEGLLAGDDDYRVISQAATSAFRDAGDATKFEEHFHEGLGAYMPQKLYYCVLPRTLVHEWGISGIAAVPDERVTTVLDVSSYSEAMTKALYCQRHRMLDSIRWLTEDRRLQWNAEYYTLIESRLNKKPRHEKDLFAGLR
jgi:LmbE family N-acetylglucosaminyl deacetylase